MYTESNGAMGSVKYWEMEYIFYRKEDDIETIF